MSWESEPARGAQCRRAGLPSRGQVGHCAAFGALRLRLGLRCCLLGAVLLGLELRGRLAPLLAQSATLPRRGAQNGGVQALWLLRSEEHTSELEARGRIGGRLLRE